MKQYYIYEIKQLANGEFEDNRSWAYDEDDTKARLKGESAYYAKLSEAAVSTYAKHSVILVSDEAFPIMYKSFKHEVEPEPQPPEEEEIPEEVSIVEPVEEEPIVEEDPQKEEEEQPIIEEPIVDETPEE